MGKSYSLQDKIARILEKDHGITATVEDMMKSGEPGFLITAGTYHEIISGVITMDRIAALADRIKAAS